MRLSLLVSAALASASTLTPPVLPLIVRNPYLSTWLTGAREEPWEKWPIFWTGNTVGFSVMVSVPDTSTVYPLLGRPQDSLPRDHQRFRVSPPKYLGATFDASTTNLTYAIDTSGSGGDDAESSVCNSLKVTLSFLSPITPSSTFRQSIPAAYLTAHVEGCQDVNLYIDVNGEWVSGNRDNHIRWELDQPDLANPTSGPGLKTWKVQRMNEELFTEFADRAEWGTLYFSAPTSVRHESGVSGRLRTHFAVKGQLENHVDDSFRQIMDEEPVFAYSKSFKLSSKNHTNHDSVMFTFGLIQDPIVQFAAARGLTLMRPFWANFFHSPEELINYHYHDFDTADRLASNYSEQLSKDAYASGSTEYEEIAALSARQVLGATEFGGTPDNPLLFLKEISSNGNCQTVDVIFPAFPFFLYTNPRWLAYLLEPLLEHQLSGQYPNDYSMHDLGYHFPNQTGHGDGNDEYMPVEECGNMLIMGLALVNAFKYDTQPAFVAAVDEAARPLPLSKAQEHFIDASGMDKPWGGMATTGEKQAIKWAAKSYKLWKQWTGYLVEYSLVPEWQLSTDDFAGWLAYQTNLALKGIIGVRAMSEIADILGKTEDAKHYLNISETYIEKWQEYGISRDGSHAKLAYDWYGSWTTLYNLYADSLLCFHIPSAKSEKSPTRSVPGKQLPIEGGKPDPTKSKSTFIPDKIYSMQSSWYHYVLQNYGLPLDSRRLWTKSDWEFFAAAITSKNRPFTDLYDTEGEGGYPGLEFKARPVVGGHFSFLALERACGGKAVEALKFLDDEKLPKINVKEALDADRAPFFEKSKNKQQAEDTEQPEMGEL
ncbi:uncharacterized protein E0L32_004674 [Thyridium curvatum]|uniref:Glutaminase A n=1 Tax=Thyridium curvatum TaxID=1093900 RepID=A0A507B7K0_9PEZI|nr:uncharacterized protein E0L32_004674 [Thyridium curvatum]TPX15116.1 hypothetical protein E0L32_004674 [Thyridium curvatum]